jgi:hypothetical protein
MMEANIRFVSKHHQLPKLAINKSETGHILVTLLFITNTEFSNTKIQVQHQED